mgnify:CR=1 FL=1
MAAGVFVENGFIMATGVFVENGFIDTPAATPGRRTRDASRNRRPGNSRDRY